MADVRCWEPHPDDQPPIIRFCGENPGHQGNHRHRSAGTHARRHPSDEWPNLDDPSPQPPRLASLFDANEPATARTTVGEVFSLVAALAGGGHR